MNYRNISQGNNSSQARRSCALLPVRTHRQTPKGWTWCKSMPCPCHRLELPLVNDQQAYTE